MSPFRFVLLFVVLSSPVLLQAAQGALAAPAVLGRLLVAMALAGCVELLLMGLLHQDDDADTPGQEGQDGAADGREAAHAGAPRRRQEDAGP